MVHLRPIYIYTEIVKKLLKLHKDLDRLLSDFQLLSPWICVSVTIPLKFSFSGLLKLSDFWSSFQCPVRMPTWTPRGMPLNFPKTITSMNAKVVVTSVWLGEWVSSQFCHLRSRSSTPGQGFCIRILHRNRTNNRCVCARVCVHMHTRVCLCVW